ncbi:MAG: BMP family ABC transporter substrate-binding protein [Candidatus Dormibacteraceae bacterium]
MAVLVAGWCGACGSPANGARAGCGAPFRVGMVTGVVDRADQTFDAAFWQGVVDRVDTDGDLCVRAQYVESSQPADFAPNIRLFAAQGYRLIVTAGPALVPATVAAARAHPGVRFATLDPGSPVANSPPNLTPVRFRQDEAGFLAGALAGLTTRTGVVGAVFGPTDDARVHRYGEGFRQGALFVHPGVRVLVVYASRSPGVVSDAEWGSARARDELQRGADVIMGGGGDAGQGALLAAGQARRLCVGTAVDVFYSEPQVRGCLLTSAVVNVSGAVETLALRASHPSRTGSEGLVMSVANGGAGLAPFHWLSSRVPARIRDHLQRIADQLADGTLATGVAA